MHVWGVVLIVNGMWEDYGECGGVGTWAVCVQDIAGLSQSEAV